MKKYLLNFNNLLGFSALFVAACAAFFSIWGIGLLFSGASISSMIMASSLELGKLVATSFLYRFWKRTQSLLKTYLCIAVVVLMGITSLGIFGYLTSAYQQSSVQYSMMQDQIITLESQKKSYVEKIDDVKKRVESLSVLRKNQEDRLSQINTNTLLARNIIQFRQVQDQTMELIDQTDKNIKTENEKSQNFLSEIEAIDKKINDVKLSSSSSKDIQTFKFVAEAMNVDLNTVVKWFILILIFVFDPLAVALVLAYNVAMAKEYAIYSDTDDGEIASNVSSSAMDIKPQENTSTQTEPSTPQVQPSVESQSTVDPQQSIASNPNTLTEKPKQDEFFKLNFAHR